MRNTFDSSLRSTESLSKGGSFDCVVSVSSSIIPMDPGCEEIQGRTPCAKKTTSSGGSPKYPFDLKYFCVTASFKGDVIM